jgi:hypothetical protein
LQWLDLYEPVLYCVVKVVTMNFQQDDFWRGVIDAL